MTQASQRVSADEMKKMVNNTIKYILIQEYTKYPIKRTDITKHAVKNVGREFPHILKLVQEKMLQCFGLKLVELQNTQRYIVVNKFSSETISGILQANEKHQCTNALLMVILAYIFMAGGVTKEIDLWAFLNKMKVSVEDNTSVFGDVKKLIQGEFVRQMYLDTTRIPQTDPPVLEFRWGARSECEIDKGEILNFVCKLHSDMPPHRWTTQWKIVQQERATTSSFEDEDDNNASMSE